jgi:hypothetical protein
MDGQAACADRLRAGLCAVAQALLEFTSEAHWLSHARKHLTGMFLYLPQQSGYNKRLRSALGLLKRVIRMLGRSSDFWLDDCWIVDATPVPCGKSRPTVKRSDLAGWAGYSYCASHSQFYWAEAVPGVHAGGDADLVGPGRPQDRPARGTGRDAGGRGGRAGQARRHPADLRRGVRREGLRDAAGGVRHHHAAAVRKDENARHGEPMLKRSAS